MPQLGDMCLLKLTDKFGNVVETEGYFGTEDGIPFLTITGDNVPPDFEPVVIEGRPLPQHS